MQSDKHTFQDLQYLEDALYGKATRGPNSRNKNITAMLIYDGEQNYRKVIARSSNATFHCSENKCTLL
jgi:hypothetical protein